jgi:hypothetical protein
LPPVSNSTRCPGHTAYLVVARKLELELDGLLQSLEAPVRLLLFERGYAQELIDGRLWVVTLELLRTVVLVLDVDVAALLLVVVFVLKVVPAMVSLGPLRAPGAHTPPRRRSLA